MFLRLFLGIGLLCQALSAQESICLPFNEEKTACFIIPALTDYQLGYNGSQDDHVFLEFIPEGEDIDHWSEIITIQNFRSLDPAYLLRKIAEEINPESQIDSYPEAQFQVASLFSDHHSKDHLNEILMIVSIADQYTTWCVQFCKRYNPNRGEKEAAIQRAQNYFKECGLQIPN